MRKLWKNFIILFLILAAMLITSNVIVKRLTERHKSERMVVTNRITDEIYNKIDLQTAKSDLYPYGIVPSGLANEVFYNRKAEWESLYGEDACPDDVIIHIIDGGNFEVSEPVDTSENDISENGAESLSEKKGYVDGGVIVADLTVPDSVRDDLGKKADDIKPIGIVEYRFADNSYKFISVILNVTIVFAAVLMFIYTLWISIRVLAPFNKLSEYPERLSKGEMTEKLPENRNKYFGRYIWGMNMLSDKLEHDRQTIGKLSVERQKFVTTMVHGIKTPTASIKLLAEAIATGLYDPEGKVNAKDAELAGKIKKNADEIEKLVESVMEEGTKAVFEYDPTIEPFYRNEVIDFIEQEYTNKLKLNRIPLTIESEGNPLIKSDRDGIFRILRQLMDNAIKYGDGEGITLSLSKNEEGHFISVINSGSPLPDSETVYVFNSLWRGSNSGGIPGSGIGLYESRLIARKLGGDIRMKTGENRTELVLFLPE